MSRIRDRKALMICQEVTMDLQVKSFRLENAGSYLFIIARGAVDMDGLKALFIEIAQSTQAFSGCRILVDLIDAIIKLDAAEIDAYFDPLTEGPWSEGNAVAFIVSSAFLDLPRLMQLRHHLFRRGLRFANFSDTKVAIEWLSLIG
jgi:hypothetical protein